MLLAHHLEMHHLVVLVTIFAAGFFIGWEVLSSIGKKKEKGKM